MSSVLHLVGTCDEETFEEESNIETKVNLEAELECALYELRKHKQKCKQPKDLML